MVIDSRLQFTTGFSTLAASWGRAPWVFEPGAVDLSPVDTSMAAIERLVRSMDESALRVRLPGQGPESGSPRRVALREVTDIAELLAQPGVLHLQANDVQLHDSGWAEVGRRFRARVEADVPEVRDPFTRVSLGLFVSSGGATAPYHADTEHNFLVQIHGSKKMHMFPPDEQTFPYASRETLAALDQHMLDNYRVEFEQRAVVVELVPGTTLYHPPMSPHWVDTGSGGPSLSFAVSFVTPSIDRLMLLHKVNRRLRRLGIAPQADGRHPALDGAKVALGRVARAVARRVRN